MISSVIIDDKKNIRNVIRNLLKRFCPDVEVLGEAGTVNEAHELILAMQPELVFLDIQLQGGTGFDMLHRFGDLNFKVIFITAFDDYAINALKMNAMDYILKPVDSKELINAVEKYRRLGKGEANFGVLLDQLKKVNPPKKIAISSIGKVQYIDVDFIVRCESDGSYTKVFLMDGKSILSTRLLREYEELLSGYHFFRLHRSHLINLGHVQEYMKNEKDKILMRDGSVVEVYRNKRRDFLDAMNKVNLA